ncbi:MAG: TetR/AcrR family transcriptional regulator [Sphingobium sp.]
MVAVQHEPTARERILAAGRDLFARHGFHQTSIAELAAEAHVSVGQIYRLFKSKADVIDAIVRVDAEERATEMRMLRDRLVTGALDIEQAFEQLVLKSMDKKDEALSYDILAEGSRNQTVSETIADMCVGFRTILRDFACAANQNLSGEELDAAEEVILACLFGLGHRGMSRPSLSEARAAKQAARMIVGALRCMT